MRITRRVTDTVAALVGVAFIGWLLWDTGLEAVAQCFRRMGWGLLLALVPYTLASLCDTQGWQVILRGISAARVKFPRLWMVRLAGEAMNSAAPTGVGGEPVKVVMLRDDGVAGSEAAASVVVSKTSLVLGQSLLVTIGLSLLLLRLGHSWSAVAALGLMLGLAGLFGLALVRLQQLGPMRSGTRMLGGLLPRLAARLGERLVVIDDRLAAFYSRHRGTFAIACGWHLLSWLVTASEVWVFFQLLGEPVALRDALIIDGLAQPVRATAIVIPGALGTQEGAGVALCAWLGIAREPAIALWLARRVREIVFDIVGFGYMSLAGARGRDRLATRGS
jgi:putative membrane protein